MSLNSNERHKLRVPRLKEVNGENRLNVIKKRGARAGITEFAEMLGGTNGRPSLLENEIYGNYCTEDIYDTKNVIAIGIQNLNNKVAKDGQTLFVSRKNREVGIRLIMEMDSDNSIPTNGKEPKRAEDGVLEVEYGYLPKRRVNNKEEEKLRKVEEKGKLIETPYEYTTDYRQMKSGEGKEIIPNKRKVYEYKGKLYIKQSFLCKVGEAVWEAGKFSNEEYFVEVLPVKWLVDLNAKKMITEDIVWAGVEFNNLAMFINKYLSKEMFQIREINKSKKSFGKLFHNLFHRKPETRALPEGTGQIEGIKQTNVNEEPKVISENIEKEQSKRAKFIENIREGIETVGMRQNNDVYEEPREDIRERVASKNIARTSLNNISNPQINPEDGEIYPQHPYYAKPKVDLSKPPYEPKGKRENAQKKQHHGETQQDNKPKTVVHLSKEYYANKKEEGR